MTDMTIVSQLSTELNRRFNATDHDNQTADIRALNSGKANKDETNQVLGTKANSTDVNTALALKANSTDVNTALALKADKTYTDQQDASVAQNAAANLSQAVQTINQNAAANLTTAFVYSLIL